MRQYPVGEPAAAAALNCDTPRRLSSLKRLRPFPHCRQRYERNLRRVHASRFVSTQYSHATVTMPDELRGVLRANRRDGCAILMKAAAEAIIELARDPRHVGGGGVLALLHTRK